MVVSIRSLVAATMMSFLSFTLAAPSALPNVIWTSRTHEPGVTQGGVKTYQGAMPLGNGGLTVLCWPNISSGGVGFYIGHQNAMDSHTALIRLGEVQVALTPNPWGADEKNSSAFFNQTLDLATASVLVYAGGTSLADYTLRMRLYVDANSDVLLVDIEARDASISVFSMSVHVTSVRAEKGGNPDVFVDPLPSSSSFIPAPPVRAQDMFRHASGHRRPSRTLPVEGKVMAGDRIGFAPGSVIVYHRNNASLDGTPIVNATLSQQGCASLIPTTPDHWSDLQSGFALDGGTGPALRRIDARTLVSAAPAGSFQLRATVLAVQTDTSSEWLTDLAAMIAAAVPDPRPAHESWWEAFWRRSWIVVSNSTVIPTTASSTSMADKTPESATAAIAPPHGAALWLTVDSLVGAINGSAVESWPGKNTPGLVQLNKTQQPTFLADAFVKGRHGVQFDGLKMFLGNSTFTLAPNASFFAVFRDDGSTGDGCCSGVVYAGRSNNGISTVAGSGYNDDEEPSLPSGADVLTMLDFAGSQIRAYTNVHGLPVVASALYRAGGGTLTIDGCTEATTLTAPSSPSRGIMIGSRNNEMGRYFKGVIGEILVYDRVLLPSEITAVESYLFSAWAGVPGLAPKAKCDGPPVPHPADSLTQAYALVRYTQAVQSRGTIWPIKFNGMAFIAAMNDGAGAADKRDWGSNNWWQNTRLPYGMMLSAGDADLMKVVLDYEMNIRIMLEQRTQLYWGHPGMWTPETHTLFGAYETSTGPAPEWPVWLEHNPYTRTDWGGDSGLGEIAVMALDYYHYTGSTQYIPLAVSAADFYMHHFKNRSDDGRVIVWPAQALEMWWCDFTAGTPGNEGYFSNCCEDDAPTVTAMIAVFSRLLALPDSLTTATQRSAWTAFTAIMPDLPVADGVILPARVLSNGTHNSEAPEFFAIHPHRLYTKGREVASGVDISLAVSTYNHSGWKTANNGWNYAVNVAALLGLADAAAPMLLARAATPSAQGYRFPGFAPHEQDFDPSADHFANMGRALQDMLIQTGDDAADTIVLMPAWPCTWDVDFKLWGPRNTSVTVVWSSGTLVSLTVDPPTRAADVKWGGCHV